VWPVVYTRPRPTLWRGSLTERGLHGALPKGGYPVYHPIARFVSAISPSRVAPRLSALFISGCGPVRAPPPSAVASGRSGAGDVADRRGPRHASPASAIEASSAVAVAKLDGADCPPADSRPEKMMHRSIRDNVDLRSSCSGGRCAANPGIGRDRGRH
jgi:hypothetical protein